MSGTGAPIIVDWGKLVSLLAIVAGIVALALADKVSGDAATGVLLVLVGYVTGNGRLAAKGRSPQPLIARHRREGDDA